MSEPAAICARLIREGPIRREELRALDLPEVRREVERRLGEVGLLLATSAYSNFVGIKLAPEVLPDEAFDSASNLGLNADACAMLVILWSRLILRKRTVSDSGSAPGQQTLLSEDRSKLLSSYAPTVRIETIVREFGDILGSKRNITRLITRLRNLGFVSVRAGRFLEAGPYLELALDGDKMMAFVRGRILGEILDRKDASTEAEPEDDPEERAFEFIRTTGHPLTAKEVTDGLKLNLPRVRLALKNLVSEGRIKPMGDSLHRTYTLME